MNPDVFLAPVGEIEPALFPQEQGGSLAERVQAYIDAATTRATAIDVPAARVDEYVTHFVYARLYDAITLRIANTPATSLSDEGSVSYSSAQLQHFAAKRDEHRAMLDAIIADITVVVRDTLPPSGSVGARFTM